MCNKTDCLLYGGACGMAKLNDANVSFVTCRERQHKAQKRLTDTKKEIRVTTPVGTIIAYDQENSDYPGVAVDLEYECDEEVERIGLANIEWGEDPNNGMRKIFAALFRNAASDDCTDYLSFEDKEEPQTSAGRHPL